MENLKDNFEVVQNTKHKDDIKIVFKIPVGNNKRWYQFWKRQNKSEKSIVELMDSYKKEVDFDENADEFFIPVKDSK